MKRPSTRLLGGALVGGAFLVSCAAAPPDPGPKSSAPTVPATSAAKAPPSLDPPRLRLPGDVAPVRYEAELTLDPAQPSFRGALSIHLAARKAVSVVWLHAEDIAIQGATVAQEGSPAPAKVVMGPAPFVAVVLPEELAAGETAVLRLDYEGKIDGERPMGLYAVSEGAGADDRYLYTLFEPLDARRVFPCFDEPEYKVPWRLSLRVKKGHSAYANAEAVSETEDGGWKKVTFAETPPLPSYLVAFMAGPFDVVDAGTVGREKKKLRFIVPRGRGSETKWAAQVTPAIVGQLEDYFGMAYPYSKLDVAVVPRYEGTMEHPGIVALGQPLTLMEPGRESVFRKQRYVNIAAHELAHYWFGDYVTMAWWDDTWLNESFAQWMDAKIEHAIEPSWSTLPTVRLARAASAMDADRLAAAKKMRQPVASVEDILNAFDGALTYNKGSAVISMMEHALGPETWREVVRRYMVKLAWRTATAADFLAVLSEVAGAEAAASFQTFLDQPGVPLVSVTPVCGAGAPKLKIEQERFSPPTAGAAATLWNVPVCVRYGAGSAKGRLCTFVGEKSEEVALPELSKCPEWVVSNEEGTGYYVTRYSAGDIDRLAGKDRPALTVAERGAALRDVGLLVSTGAVPLGKAMELVPGVVASADRTTMLAVQSIFQNLHPSDLPEPLYKKLQAFVRKTFGPRAKELGFAPKPDEKPGTAELRSMFLYSAGFGGEDAGLRKEAKALALAWLDGRALPSPDVKNVVLGLAMSTNDPALFDRFVARAKAAADRQEKSDLFLALGKVTDEALARRALDLVLAKDFDLHETMPILGQMLSERRTRDLAYDFLKKSFRTMLDRSTGFERPYLFVLPDELCDEAHRADVAAFFGPFAKEVEGAERRLASTVETIGLCDQSRKAALPSLEVFLKKY